MRNEGKSFIIINTANIPPVPHEALLTLREEDESMILHYLALFVIVTDFDDAYSNIEAAFDETDYGHHEINGVDEFSNAIYEITQNYIAFHQAIIPIMGFLRFPPDGVEVTFTEIRNIAPNEMLIEYYLNYEDAVGYNNNLMSHAPPYDLIEKEMNRGPRSPNIYSSDRTAI